MAKVVCIGECLVDMTQSKNGYVPNAGGAPCNVCACVASLGGAGAYIGKLGGDEYADFLFEQIKSARIDTRFVVFDHALKTALAYVDIDENGDRKFRFERENTADLNLSEEDIRDDCLQKGDVLHFCSLGLAGKSKNAHKKAVNVARKNGAIVSFDVNIRQNLWTSVEECTGAIEEFLPFADIVKASSEELDLLSHGDTIDEKAKNLLSTAVNCKILVVTKGADGAVAYDRELRKIAQKAYSTKVVNTTGAGDCFIGSILYLLSQGVIALDLNSMAYALDFAARACAIQISRDGSMTAMPTKAEVEDR